MDVDGYAEESKLQSKLAVRVAGGHCRCRACVRYRQMSSSMFHGCKILNCSPRLSVSSCNSSCMCFVVVVGVRRVRVVFITVHACMHVKMVVLVSQW